MGVFTGTIITQQSKVQSAMFRSLVIFGRYTIRSMMGDFGGYSAVFEIQSVPPKSKQASDNGTETAYRYEIHITPFVVIYIISVLIGCVIAWFVMVLLLFL